MAQVWYQNGLLWTLAAGVLILVAAAVALIVWLRIRAPRRELLATLRGIADRLILDVVVPDGIGGFVPVDALLLRDRTLYVLDLCEVEGAVFGSEKMDLWTAMGRRRQQFKNPLRPMHDRVAAVKYLVPGIAVAPRILFTSRAHFPKGRPEGVQLLEEFAQPLLRQRPTEPVDVGAELQSLWLQLCEAANVPPGKERPLSSR